MPKLTAARGPADGEVVEFFGAPASLLATVAMHNASEEVLRLRRTVPIRQRWAPGAVDPHPTHFAQRALLAPGTTLAVPVRLAVSPQTPPGDHDVNVDVGGVIRRAVLHVAEVVDLTVSPAEIVISNSGQEQHRRIVVINSGNVVVTVRSTAAPLDDERLACRALRAAAHEFSERYPDDREASGDREPRGDREARSEPEAGSERKAAFDGFLSELVRQADRALRNAGVLRVRSVDGEIAVQPGETRMITLAFSVPETIDKHTRYAAFIPIATEDLVVRVVPSLGAVADGSAPDAVSKVGKAPRRDTGRRQSGRST